jgi:hypothetical protein
MKRSPHPMHYLTVDQLNAATAEQLADDRGVSLEPAEPRDIPQLEKQNARIILDWDFIPPDYRDRVLASSTLRVVAIHGFNVPDSVAAFLQRRGILSFKLLCPEMFRSLDSISPAA